MFLSGLVPMNPSRSVASHLHSKVAETFMATLPHQGEVRLEHPRQRVTEPLSVRLCSDWQDLEEYRGDWERLLYRNPHVSIFCTPEWLGSWWQAFQGDKQLHALVFLDPGGAVAGVAALFLEREPGFPYLSRCLRFVGAGSGDSDALDFVTAPGAERAVTKCFMHWLKRQKQWSICSLETLPAGSLTGQYIAQMAEEWGWRVAAEKLPHSFVDLPATWPDYLQQLASDFRPLLTRYPKRLRSRYNVRVFRCEQVEELESHLQTLFTLHQMRWTGRGEPGAFSSKQRREFYSLMGKAFLRRGWLEFWMLVLENEIVAAQFCFRHRQTVYLLQEGFNPGYAAEKIGYALRAHVLQEMIQSGAKRYDFLGGEDAYKLRFGASRGAYVSLHLAGPSWVGRMTLAGLQYLRTVKRFLKKSLPPRLLAMMKREGAPQPAGE